MPNVLDENSVQIREVWSDNLENEFNLILPIVDDYPYIGLDTEFPGIVVKPTGEFSNRSENNYQALKENVNKMKLIQLGITFSNAEGELPTCGTDKYCVWQFNFREFNRDNDLFAPASIDLLVKSGIDFDKFREKGVSSYEFSQLLMSSGIVLNDSAHIVTFHGGYDIGYMLKLLSGKDLPETQESFLNLLRIFFPNFYDIKHLIRFCNGLYGGLDWVSRMVGVNRIGTAHQAGSDSLLTILTYLKLKEIYFKGSPEKHAGVLEGFGNL